MHALLRNIIAPFNQIIQPKYCTFCLAKIPANHELPICLICLEKLEKNPPPFCENCGRSIKDTPSQNGLCKECLMGNSRIRLKTYYVFKYTGIIKEGLKKFKYHSQKNLCSFFAQNMYNFLKENILPFERIDAISCVPLHAKRLREREFNQSFLLAKAISKKSKIPVLADLLMRARDTLPQSELDFQRRQANIKGAFKINKKYMENITDSKILLIDDIITTGSTVEECAKEISKVSAQTTVLAAAGG